MKVEITIGLKDGVADPEGKNTLKALRLLGFQAIREVHSERRFVLEVDAADRTEAHEMAERMCTKLLANPVVHTYRVEVMDD